MSTSSSASSSRSSTPTSSPRPSPRAQPEKEGWFAWGAKWFAKKQLDGKERVISEQIKGIFYDALLKKAPNQILALRTQLNQTLSHPTAEEYHLLKALLKKLKEKDLKQIDPTLSDQKMRQLLGLRAHMKEHIVLQTKKGGKVRLTIPDETKKEMKQTAKTVDALLKSSQGFFAQACDELVKKGGFLEQIQDKLVGKSILEIAEAHKALKSCKKALKKPDPQKHLPPLLTKFLKKWNALKNRKKEVKDLSKASWRTTEDFSVLVQGLLDDHAKLNAASHWLHGIDYVLKILEDATEKQKGIWDAVREQIENKLGNVLPSSSSGGKKKANQAKYGEVGLEFIQKKGGELLSAITASAGGAISTAAAKQLATVVCFVFGKIKEHIEQDGKHDYLLKEINPLLKKLKKAKKEGKWNNLVDGLQNAFTFIREQQVWLQGIRIPLNPVRSASSPIPDYLKIVEKHRNALHPKKKQDKKIPTAKLIEKQTTLLQARAASFGPAKFVTEQICQIKTSELFFSSIYTMPSTASVKHCSEKFRKRLFEKIDQSDASAIRRSLSKFVYDYIGHPLSSFYTGAIIKNALQFVENWTAFEDGSLAAKELYLIQIIRNWLAVTSGAYNEVAEASPSKTKDLSKMLEEALKAPIRNGGLNPKQLYAASAKTALSLFGPKIQWSDTAWQFFNNITFPPDSYFSLLNVPLKKAHIACGFLASTLLFLPQWIGNFFLHGIANVALSHTSQLEAIVSERIEAIKLNTPATFAIHKLVYTQLKKIHDQLIEQMDEEIPAVDQETHLVKKKEIESLIKYAYEVLQKSRCLTQDSLRNTLKGKVSLRAKIEKEIDETFLPEAIDTLATTTAASIKSLMQKGEMENLVYEGLCIANETFEHQTQVSDVDFTNTEKAIRKLIDEILEASIFDLINKQCDFKREKEKKGLKKFFRSLKKDTLQFTKEIKNLSKSIATHLPKDPKALVKATGKMVAASEKFHKERLDALFGADKNSNFHSEVKGTLSELSSELKDLSEPLASKMNQMKQWADQAAMSDQYVERLKKSQTTALSLSNVKKKSIPSISKHLKTLQKHLSFLRDHGAPKKMLQTLETQVTKIKSKGKQLKEIQNAKECLANMEDLFSQIANEKLDEPTPSSKRKGWEKEFASLHKELPSSKLGKELLEIFQAFLAASNPKKIKEARKRFDLTHDRLSERLRRQREQVLPKVKKAAESLHSSLSKQITSSGRLKQENRKKIKRINQEILQQTPKLSQWVSKQRASPIWTLFLFDMQWIVDISKNLAKQRAESKVNDVFKSLYQPSILSGMIHIGALVPFLKATPQGKKHLREKTSSG